MLQFAFGQLRLPRIISWTHRDNARSLALMRRIGMELKAERDQPESIAGVIENKPKRS
jgi:RimJ/RimL family protein N-acetyltransferase